MSKRSLASVPASPSRQKKKTKLSAAAGQSRLDSFFGASSNLRPNSEGSSQPSGSKLKASTPATPAPSLRKEKEGITDEEVAWALATADGLDLDALRQLESRGSSAGHSQGASARHESTHSEVIDVDALSDESSPEKTASYRRTTPASTAPSTIDRSPNVPGTPAPARIQRATIGNALPSDTPTYEPLNVDPPTYDLDHAPWSPNAPVPYSFLAHTLATLSGTRSRIAKLDTLTNALRTICRQHPPSLLPALYLLSNSLSPPYSPIELGLGPSIISKAIQHVSGLSSAALKRLYNQTGDPGDVAFEAKSNVRTLIPHPPLLITGVYDSLLKIAHAKGSGAAKTKQAIVEKLLVAARGEETRFLVRTLGQNLRVGAVRTALAALARAMVLTPPPTVTAPIPDDSPFRVSGETLAGVKPLAAKKKVADEARDALNEVYLVAESLLKRVYVQHPNYDHIVEALLEVGLDGLAKQLPLTVGVPLLPTLGSPTRSLDEIYDRLGFLPFTAEFKYDGQRAQIHASRGSNQRPFIRVFSRHLEDMTDKYPDVVSLVQEIFKSSPQTESFIIDAEVVAVDPETGALKTFQELSNRARKDVKLDEVKVSVCVFAFDIMFLDGQILLERPFRERRNMLRTRFPPYTPPQHGMARFDHVKSVESEEGREVVEEFWQTAVNSSCEGLMIKLLDSGEILEEPNQKKEKPRRKPLPATYEPDKRTSAWLKLKKDYVVGLGDSLDLVPIGAWHGNGRKAQWWSPILLAVWDPDAQKLVAVCKCMSGFSDAFYKSLRERYPEGSDTCSSQPMWQPECDTGGLRPEVYFKPQEVWEIRGADVTISPVSVAAMGLISQTRGLSLRFPRFMSLREDKGIEDASTPEFLANMYRSQQAAGKDQTGADEGELVDVVDEGEDDEDAAGDSEGDL
ncbi:ATP-dependent DNA ligase [Lentinus tigrinus ALCF2SS1-6]|uniref:DNA ligase n=1 Tax=Lentinus tigrinus ALCF2SS1-6 TaxID=1328759 RepID=A0A5C2S972_9APHY|nr:ATP-dependent DNA ligase [Lentinus tigrinus ALCF2SS1-6]